MAQVARGCVGFELLSFLFLDAGGLAVVLEVAESACGLGLYLRVVVYGVYISGVAFAAFLCLQQGAGCVGEFGGAGFGGVSGVFGVDLSVLSVAGFAGAVVPWVGLGGVLVFEVAVAAYAVRGFDFWVGLVLVACFASVVGVGVLFEYLVGVC